jgi:hypothetical protein
VFRVQHLFPAPLVPIQDFIESLALRDTLLHVFPAILYFDILRMNHFLKCRVGLVGFIMRRAKAADNIAKGRILSSAERSIDLSSAVGLL